MSTADKARVELVTRLRREFEAALQLICYGDEIAYGVVVENKRATSAVIIVRGLGQSDTLLNSTQRLMDIIKTQNINRAKK